MAIRTITADHANAFTLARQWLIAPAADIPSAAARLLCIQTQYDQSLYGSLALRVAGISAHDVEHALFEQRSILKTWTVRSTLHTIHSEDLPLFTAAIGQDRAQSYQQQIAEWGNYSPEELEQINQSILAALSDGPRSRAEIHAATPLLQRLPHKGWGTDIKLLTYQGEVVFGYGKTFARRQHWLPNLEWNLPPAEQARQLLVKRYFSAYGPATMRDLAHWAGWKISVARQQVAALKKALLPLHIADWPETAYILAEDEPTLNAIQPQDTPSLLLLPKFDVLAVSYRNKTRWLEAEHLPLIYRIAGQIEGSVLWHGRMIAAWRHQKHKNELHLRIQPFKRINKTQQRQLQRAAEQLARFYACTDASLKIVDAL